MLLFQLFTPYRTPTPCIYLLSTCFQNIILKDIPVDTVEINKLIVFKMILSCSARMTDTVDYDDM